VQPTGMMNLILHQQLQDPLTREYRQAQIDRANADVGYKNAQTQAKANPAPDKSNPQYYIDRGYAPEDAQLAADRYNKLEAAPVEQSSIDLRKAQAERVRNPVDSESSTSSQTEYAFIDNPNYNPLDPRSPQYVRVPRTTTTNKTVHPKRPVEQPNAPRSVADPNSQVQTDALADYYYGPATQPAAQATSQPAAQQAGEVAEGTVIVNRKTGQRLRLTNGQWVLVK
jgi:hypothetical protein